MFHRNLLCRICLNESNEIVSMDSYLSDQINVRVQEALEKVMSFPLIIHDVYPNQICRVCLGNLRISYELRIEFERSESILMKCYTHVHPPPDNKPKSSFAPVEVIYGSNKYDLKDLVIVEEPQITEMNFGGFLNNLGQSISATFVDKKCGISSKQKSETPDISVESVENNTSKRSCRKKVKTTVLSTYNGVKNNSSIVNRTLSDSSIEMGKIEGQFQFVFMDQSGYGSFDKSVVLQSCDGENEIMIEEYPQIHPNVEIIEFENQSSENLEISSDKNELIAVETKNIDTNEDSLLSGQYIIQTENLKIANEVNKNDLIAIRRKGKARNRESIIIDQYIIENNELPNESNKNDLAVRTKGKYGNRESMWIDQYIIEAGKEDNKSKKISNDQNDLVTVGSKQKCASRELILIDQYIVQANSQDLEIAREGNKDGLLAVGPKPKYHNEESRLIDQYIIEAENNVKFISEDANNPKSLQLLINIATNDEARQTETNENQQANIPLACKICKLKFQTRHSYDYHRLTKHSEQRYMCHFCGRKFYTKGSLSRHIVSHTDKTSVLCICPVCGKTFNYKGGLFYHMKRHTNERKYGCDYCDRKFYTSSTKKRHQSTHTGERPHSCDVCNRKFFSSGELRKHKYRHTVERPHHCGFCGKGFTSRFNMNIHLFSHPGNFLCEICNRGFVSEDVLKFHYRSKHKNCIVQEAGNS